MSVTETRGPLGGEWLTVADREDESVQAISNASNQYSIYFKQVFFLESVN